MTDEPIEMSIWEPGFRKIRQQLEADRDYWKARAEAAEVVVQTAKSLNREAIREALIGRAEDWNRSDQYRQRYLFALGDVGSLFAAVDALPAEEAVLP